MFYISANLCRGEAEWIQRQIYFGTICYFHCVTFSGKQEVNNVIQWDFLLAIKHHSCGVTSCCCS